jgi:hypothetical protein
VIAAQGHGWELAIFPLVAAVTALAFAVVLAARLASRWRTHEAVWLVALLMYAVGSAAMFVGVLRGWSDWTFRSYWLFGAVLNVPFLAQGEVYLLVRSRRAAHVVLALVVAASVLATWEVFRAPVAAAPLSRALPLGKDALGDDSLAYRLAQLYAIPAYFFLLGGLLWSGRAMRGRPELRDRAVGILGIAVGATIVAIGSGIGAARDIVPLFAVSLAAGVAVMFAGFLRSGRPQAAPAASAGSPRPD